MFQDLVLYLATYGLQQSEVEIVLSRADREFG